MSSYKEMFTKFFYFFFINIVKLFHLCYCCFLQCLDKQKEKGTLASRVARVRDNKNLPTKLTQGSLLLTEQKIIGSSLSQDLFVDILLFLPFLFYVETRWTTCSEAT